MAQYSGIWTMSQASQAIQAQTWSGNLSAPPEVEYLVVAGGGGASTMGGGGGGGVIAGYASIPQSTQIWITVGSGGAGLGSTTASACNGNNSVLFATSSGASTGTFVAYGGGGGGAYWTGSGMALLQNLVAQVAAVMVLIPQEVVCKPMAVQVFRVRVIPAQVGLLLQVH